MTELPVFDDPPQDASSPKGDAVKHPPVFPFTDSPLCQENDASRLRALEERVKQKMQDADGYGFSHEEQRLLSIFFDLAQEFDTRRDLMTLCVLLPSIFFGQEIRVYLRTTSSAWRLTRCLTLPQTPPDEPPTWSTTRGTSFFSPIKGRKDTGELLGFPLEHGVIGWIEVVDGASFSSSRQMFYEIYAGRIGHQIHNRLARAKSREHLAFIQNLVADIGHNVIVPNMTFKLFFNRLRGSLTGLQRLVLEAPEDTPSQFLDQLESIQTRMAAQYDEINRHYEQTSLFLETLLRRRHFEEGRYVLEKRLVNLRQQVVDPQVEHFRPRLHDRGISIDLSMGGIPDSTIMLMVDLGLIAQVYANLFSNAVKYTRAVPGPQGQAVKFMAYGWDILPNAFGPERHGVKLNVFTTGPVIPETEREQLFQPGFRASTTAKEHGTGQGLAFMRQVVALHGGRVGYEAAPLGNNFFIVLPLEQGGTECL